MDKKSRIQEYDILKGFAITLVCVGHIIQSIASDFASLKVYSIIFAIQMPLFVIISGYFGVKKNIDSIASLFKIIKKRLVAYMVPFFSIILFRTAFDFQSITMIEWLKKILLISMDSGLWYLWVIFFLFLSLQFAIFTKEKIFKNKKLMSFPSFISDAICFGIYMLPWAMIALLCGTGFFGAKFVLYYGVFYFAGYVYREYIEEFLAERERVTEAFGLVSIVLGIVIATRVNFEVTPDTIPVIILRAITGLLLSYGAIFVIVKKHLWVDCKLLRVVGENTLEIYYVHGIGFALLGATHKVPLYSIEGQLMFWFSVILTVIYTYLVIKIVHRNKFLSLLLFGKAT